MTLYGIFFYLISAVVIAATGVAVTRENLLHAVVYLIVSFFGTAMLFYLFGAPLLAALEVIIYAGAIMVLFLFVVMMINPHSSGEALFPPRQFLPAVFFCLLYLLVAVAMAVQTPGMNAPLQMLTASPRLFATYVFKYHWFSIEVVSMLLLLAAIGALNLGAGSKSEVEKVFAAQPEEAATGSNPGLQVPGRIED
ncbi:MAG: NADH-quinone oxidoreductase subunit J family protein [Syntrophobacteraceae bacterium]